MKIFRFDSDVGKSIAHFNSSGFILSRVVQLLDEAFVNCAYLSPGGVIGYHQAAIPQLFMVVHGEGWVRSETSDKTSIKAGEAAYWEKDEWHESGTNTALTAIIIEGVNIDLSRLIRLA